MFIEVITRDYERVSINIPQIVTVMPHGCGSIIFDSNEIFFELEESYESVMGRIYALLALGSED